jgi:predicted ATPase/DNA-binding XRE family transcriptional regulator
MSFGTELKELRLTAGLTQEGLAERAGLTANGVSSLERGIRTHPYPHTVSALAEGLALTGEQRERLLAAARNRGALTAAPAARTTAGGLPASPTSLIGREDDIGKMVRLLERDDVRLVTLTGPGGVGKTRLAVEAARQARPSYPDGVAFVELASLADASLVVPVLGSVVGAGDGYATGSELGEQLRGRTMLVVLDNFEHLMAAAGSIAELSAACPQLTVLVSSRARLRLRGEVEYSVEPLSLPPSTRDLEPGAVTNSSAGRLFVDRVRDLQPDFVVTSDTAADIAAICWRLGGLPLALELAAAKVKLLGPGVLLERLDTALSMGWSRDLPVRQQTLRATLDWSYRLLDDGARHLLERLSVFAGGFSLEHAEALAAPTVEPEQVVELLDSLVEHSLVRVVPDPDGRTHYALLEPIRQYAAELLDSSGRSAAVRRAHADYFLALAEQAASQYSGPDQVQWLERRDWESDNLRAAMLWALSADDGETAARLGWAQWLLWWMRGQLREGRHWMDRTLALEMPPLPRTRALLAHACMTYAQGDLAAAERSWAEALEIARRSGDTAGEAYSVAGMGLIAMPDDAALAAALLQESISLSRAVGDEWMSSLATIWLGTLLLIGGDVPAARPMFEQALTTARSRGDRLVMCVALYNLAEAAVRQGDDGGAAELLREDAALSAHTRDHANLAYTLDLLAEISARASDYPRAAVLLGAGRAMRQVSGAPVYNYYLTDPSRRTRIEADAEAALGTAAFRAGCTQGQALDLDAAARYAAEPQTF